MTNFAQNNPYIEYTDTDKVQVAVLYAHN